MAHITELPFVVARIPLLNVGTSTNMLDKKHSQDRTMQPVKRFVDAVTALRIARSETLSCLEAKKGTRSDVVTLSICEPERFQALQDQIEATAAEIVRLEGAITRMDAIITTNSIGDGWIDELKHRLSSAHGSIIQQQGNISSWAGWFATKHKRAPPEEAMKDPDFLKKRVEAEAIIAADKAYLDRVKPLVSEIENILLQVGC